MFFKIIKILMKLINNILSIFKIKKTLQWLIILIEFDNNFFFNLIYNLLSNVWIKLTYNLIIIYNLLHDDNNNIMFVINYVKYYINMY